AILTDEGELFDPIGRLRTVYPNVMRLDFENRKPAGGRHPETAARGDVSHKDPMELFEEFFLL
ncbi:MAG TPA: exonuclease sbcCD subunit D, partial [Ruminococcaceae bacterium]|nr:exonuclease sbcCD subunit D [Oscillospiraceae bacterium]